MPEQRLSLRKRPLPTALISNPLDRSYATGTPDPPTHTLPSRVVYTEAQAHLKPLLRGIQTREQMDELVRDLRAVQ